ncbi:DoxX family protein [Pseudoalteromonas sp. MMG013]|nr:MULTISPECIES: DoxX family protein [Pseudoalteromonas]MBQ4847437.1 DoxX family protein [Pseudoalteromonas sp. MMG005]MBQ4861559.1 DoxX family protein [Pseudoalteromonas sp. MMG013]
MKTLLRTLTASHSSYASFALRLPVGVIFMAHGGQKLFGWFGGYGLDGTAGFMASIGLAPGLLMALLAGCSEFVGGLFILLGLLTRPAASVLAITMLVAIFAVHLTHGLFMSNNGYEFALALLAASASLVISGSGKLALDNHLANRFA